MSLTDAEREALLSDDLALDNLRTDWGQHALFQAVEAIVAERERAAVERRDGEWRALVCTCGDIKPYGYGPHVGKWVAYLAARNEAAALVAEEREESW